VAAPAFLFSALQSLPGFEFRPCEGSPEEGKKHAKKNDGEIKILKIQGSRLETAGLSTHIELWFFQS
jgi:hypothetical protein